VRLGFFLPQIGPWAGPEPIAQVARRAEELGFDSLWVTERSLVPLEPKTPYPLGELPDVYKTVLDPLDALTFAAAHTSRVALGTAILCLPWYSPVLVARRLTTIDVLSKGRLRAGFGIGWSEDEHDVAESDFATRGRRLEEAIHALKTIWTTDPVEFAGEFYSIPRSFIGPKPVQKPHPPIYIGAFAPPAIARAARVADGWIAAAFPVPTMAEVFAGIKRTAARAGRDPAALELIVRANVELSEQPLGQDRMVFKGTPEQIASDLSATREIGATEVIMDATFDPGVRSVDDFLGRMELLLRLAETSSAAVPA
jgi:probable F420-dependent oxidoreductase